MKKTRKNSPQLSKNVTRETELNWLENLPTQEGYDTLDRYRDFRKVFGSEEGKRVFKEILSWGRIFKQPTLGKPIDPYIMAVSFGERNIALKLLTVFNTEPVSGPQKQRKTP